MKNSILIALLLFGCGGDEEQPTGVSGSEAEEQPKGLNEFSTAEYQSLCEDINDPMFFESSRSVFLL